MEFNAWLDRVKSQSKPFRNGYTDEQILVLHENDTFIMYVIGVNGLIKKGKCFKTGQIYKYLLDHYCNCGNKVSNFKKVNVYYDDPAVKIAFERGIKIGDTWYKVKEQDHGSIINQTTMFKCINLRWVHYYFGIDIGVRKKEDENTYNENIEAVIKAISERDPAEAYRVGFTAHLKKKFVTQTTYTDFVITKKGEATSDDYNMLKTMAKYSNLGALIGCTRNRELRDIYSYDITSAYIYHLFSNEFPSAEYFSVNPEQYECADKDENAFFIIAKISAIIKPEYFYKEIFPMPAGYIAEVLKEKCSITEGGKVKYCEDMVIGLWDKDLKYINEFYDVLNLNMLKIYQFKLKPLPADLKREMLSLYRKKQRKKELHENYKTEKILLNRGGYGLWVTKKDDTNPYTGITSRIQSDWDVPFQIGSYIVALQRELLLEQMQILGMENIVAFHTDSIKTSKCFDEYFERYNESIDICDDLGHFEREWKADRIFFYNSVRYKAVTDKGELIVKHGGIDEKDMFAVFAMNYDDITKDTEIEIDKPNTTWIDPETAVKTCKRIITQMSKTEDYMIGRELLAI